MSDEMYVIVARAPGNKPMVLCEAVHGQPEWVCGRGAMSEALRFIYLESAQRRCDRGDLGLVANPVRAVDVPDMFPEIEAD